MKVAVIGAGNVGKALGGSAARAGHDVVITARTPEHAKGVAEQIDGVVVLELPVAFPERGADGADDNGFACLYAF